jgi:hypothetical protein
VGGGVLLQDPRSRLARLEVRHGDRASLECIPGHSKKASAGRVLHQRRGAQIFRERLGIFQNAVAGEDSLTSISFSFPATPSEVYSLVTWATQVHAAIAIGELAAGVVIVQDKITGDVAVADQLAFSELIQKLETLVQK